MPNSLLLALFPGKDRITPHRSHTLCVLVSAVLLPCSLSAQTQKAIIVLDASGSMWGEVNGEAKIEIARQVTRELVLGFPDNIELGLVSYGHRRKGDCKDIELVIPVGKMNEESFVRTVEEIIPRGMTPLTDALEFAANALKLTEQRATVIIVTDGLETCDRDPCEAAAKLEKLGVDFTAHVVAFDLKAEDALKIECIATETGGRFLPAQDAGSLKDALDMAIQEVVVAEVAVDPEPEPEEDPATLTVPKEVPAGSVFEMTWDGPDNPGDFVTIVPIDTEEGRWRNHAYTKQGNTLELTALIDPQQAEVRYLSGRSRKVLGRATITITKIEATLSAISETVAGSKIDIEWTGPANAGDFITIVAKDAKEGTWKRYAYARSGTPSVKVGALLEAGAAEIRYITGQGRKTLARRGLMVTAAEATVFGPDEAVAGSKVEIEWTGPANQSDYVTIVPKEAKEGKSAGYAYAKEDGKPLSIKVPLDPGLAEIRYVAAGNRKTLARQDIMIVKAVVTLKANKEAVAGSEVEIEWSGPANQSDYITIVPKDTQEGKSAKYQYAKKPVKPVKIAVPMQTGPAEIRYVSAGSRETLARLPILVTEAKVTLTAKSEATVGNEISIEWIGPGNKGDFITIVSADAAEGVYAKRSYAPPGKRTVKVAAPMVPGKVEIRYCAGADRSTLAKVELTLKEANISLKAPPKAAAKDKIEVTWKGPNNSRDYLTIVPVGSKAGTRSFVQFVSKGSPTMVKTPKQAGKCEIRYVSGQGGKTLGSEPIEITPPK